MNTASQTFTHTNPNFRWTSKAHLNPKDLPDKEHPLVTFHRIHKPGRLE